MAGLLLLLGTVWAWYMLNQLWQGTLTEGARDGVVAATALGLSVRPAGYRARIVAEGPLDGALVRVEWRDGLRGPRTTLWRGGHRLTVPGLADGEAVNALLGAESQQPGADFTPTG